MKRSEVEEKYKWHLEDLVASDEEFEAIFKDVSDKCDVIAQYQGKLGDRDSALACLKLASDIEQKLTIVYVFSHMRMHGDMANSEFVGAANRTDALSGKVMTAEAFVQSELGALPDEVIDSYIADPAFSDYDFSLSELKRQKAHILSDKEEKLLAMSAEALSATENIASMLMDADMKFKPVVKDGKKQTLTNETFGVMLGDDDRKVRKAAFNNLYDGYIAHINTLAANYGGNIKADNFRARARGYNDCLEQSLDADGIPTAVYTNLLAAVDKNLEPMHRYMKLRKKLLGLSSLHMYDLHVPLVKNAQMTLPYEQACETVKAALAPMGEDYVALLNKAMTEGWIDVMQNDGKHGGAYSWGAYGVHPYVMLNYAPTTNDIFVIAHELGHCLHTYYSHSAQPYDKSGYRIFVAEVASICSETLLLDHLLREVKDKDIKRYLISYRLDMFRTTLYRQAMFAEFEFEAHKLDLEGKPLTVDALNGLYLDLNKKYYGPATVSDPAIAYEWARIPHFYNAFYVYKYATGITAATSIAHNILTRSGYVDIYKNKFLRAGGSKNPYEILCDTDVDLATEKPYNDAFAVFTDALDKLESI